MTATEAKKKIQQLTGTINHHNYLYYQESRTEIGDLEFDQLMKQLEQLEKEHPELRQPDLPTLRVGARSLKNLNR